MDWKSKDESDWPTSGAWYYEMSLITGETPGSLPVPVYTLKWNRELGLLFFCGDSYDMKIAILLQNVRKYLIVNGMPIPNW